MEKLSFYEIISFLIPGFILVSIILIYRRYVFGLHDVISMDIKFGYNLLLICTSLFVGVVLHIFTFWLLKRKEFAWFKKIIMPSNNIISGKNEFINLTIPYLNEEYRKLKKHDDEIINNKEADNYLFDFAYYYLEVNDKIYSAKNFQSIYFWFRNMFTISLFLIPISIIIYFITLYNCYSCEHQLAALLIIICNIILFFILIPSARWLREKYIDKIFWSFYVERIFQKEKLKNK